MDASQRLLAGECANNLCTWASLCYAICQTRWQCLSRAASFDLTVDILRRTYVHSSSLLGGRPMVGLQTLDLAIGVRVPASQPTASSRLGDRCLSSSRPFERNHGRGLG